MLPIRCLFRERLAYSHVETFIRSQYKVSDRPFTALDLSFIEKYDLHLRTECRLAPGTVINLTIRLKTIVGEAVADGIITAYPFFGYEPVHPKPEQKYLTDEELHRIMATPCLGWTVALPWLDGGTTLTGRWHYLDWTVALP